MLSCCDEPGRDDAQGLLEYEDMGHRLQEMERVWLVGGLYVRTRARHSAEYFDSVTVRGDNKISLP
jgi:hypothetical protein